MEPRGISLTSCMQSSSHAAARGCTSQCLVRNRLLPLWNSIALRAPCRPRTMAAGPSWPFSFATMQHTFTHWCYITPYRAATRPPSVSSLSHCSTCPWPPPHGLANPVRPPSMHAASSCLCMASPSHCVMLVLLIRLFCVVTERDRDWSNWFEWFGWVQVVSVPSLLDKIVGIQDGSRELNLAAIDILLEKQITL